MRKFRSIDARLNELEGRLGVRQHVIRAIVEGADIPDDATPAELDAGMRLRAFFDAAMDASEGSAELTAADPDPDVDDE